MEKRHNLPCNIDDVIELLGIPVIRNTGSQLHCRCPFCRDRKAHMNVRLSRNVFRCNRCGCGGGVLHLYAAFHDVSLAAAYDELVRIFSRDGETTGCRMNRKQEMADLIPEAALASSRIRNHTYSNLLSLLSLGATHREALLMRGLSGDDIMRLGYRTTPAVRSPKIVAELLNRGCILEGVPGFFRDPETGKWKLDIRSSGMMIPDRNSMGEIEAIQIRLDKVYRSKFHNLTSTERYYGVSASCCPHFVGIAPGMDTVCLTEGVMKADIAYCLTQAMGKPAAFVGLTGVGNRNQLQRALDELKTWKIRRILVAVDMDYQTNENVRVARDRILEAGLDAGFEMEPLRWETQYKGIDDLLWHFRKKRTGKKGGMEDGIFNGL